MSTCCSQHHMEQFQYTCVQLLVQSLYMKICTHWATLLLLVTAAICPRTVCDIMSPSKAPNLVFPIAWCKPFLTAMTLPSDNQTPHLSSGNIGRQPVDRASHIPRLAASLRPAATFWKNEVQPDSQCACTLWGVLVTIVTMEKPWVLHILSVWLQP